MFSAVAHYCNSLPSVSVLIPDHFSADEEIMSSDDDEIICLNVHSPEKKKIKSEVDIKSEVTSL